MNKAVAEILAGIIPHKRTRNRWRGILRYGPVRGLKLAWRMMRKKPDPSYYLAVCAIAKDEGPYFKEWIEWHRKQGVEKFYIYDNDSTDNTQEVLRPYIEEGVVDYTRFPGTKMQIKAYDDCIIRHRFESRWLAFIDLDEFIVPVKDKTAVEFLRRMEGFSSVEINWLVYGSGGQQKKSEEPVMRRFKMHSKGDHYLNYHVKSIVNPRKVFNMIGCHEAARISGKAADSHGEPVKVHFRKRQPQHDVIKVNHYAVRSREEFEEKQNRGRASGKHRTISDSYFREYDLNDIED